MLSSDGTLPEHNSFRTYDYPYDYVFVTIEHLVMDKGYQLRYSDLEIGRIVAHIEPLGLLGPGVRGIFDASVSRTGKGIWVWVHMNFYSPINNTWMDEWREKFIELLDDRLENNYTGDIIDDTGAIRVQVSPLWPDLLDIERGVWHGLPQRIRAIMYCIVAGSVMLVLPILYFSLGIYDGFPNWFFLSFLSFPPFLAAFLVYAGQLEKGNFVLNWIGFGVYFVFGIATLILGWIVLMHPLIYAGSLIDETMRWEEIRKSVEERKQNKSEAFESVCSRSNKRKRGIFKGPVH